jgi:hypothetical protein
MPIARIRTFDPEAILFLAAKLAASGYQLQFAAPGEDQLKDADLEITVTRMDSATALEQARLQAEDMDVDVTVMPGVLTAPGLPFAAPPEVKAEAEHSPEAIVAEDDPTLSSAIAAWTTPYHVDVPDDSESAVRTQASEAPLREVAAPIHSRTQEATETILTGLKRSADVLGDFAASSAERMREWKRHTSEARDLKRAKHEQELAAAMAEQKRKEEADLQAEQIHQASLRENPPILQAAAPVPVTNPRPRLVTRAPLRLQTLYSRDRRFRNAAVAAALVVAGAMIGWSLAGLGGPANPLQNALSNVQQKTPFGSASVSAPTQGFAAPPHSATIAPAPVRTVAKPTPTRATRTVHTGTRHHSAHRSASADDGEVVVRHFGTKPVAQQAKAKTKDGVKIITEE